MSIIRAILNNGFFIIILIVASVLYIAYSDNIKRDHGLLPDNAHAKLPLAENENATKAKPTPIEDNSDHSESLAEPAAQITAKASDTPELAESNQESEKTDLTTDIEAISPGAETAIAEKETVDPEPTPETTVENNASEAVQQKPTSVLTSELDSILNDSSTKQTIPSFESEAAALSAARHSMMQRDFETAAKIYFDVATKAPSANNTGELARALYLAGKKDWAARAWLESAKQLVAEQRIPEASMLASRLMPFAPQVSNEIRMNLQKIHQQRMQSAQKNMPSMPQQQIAPMKPMPNMPSMPQMPQQQMVPMKPMPNMLPMAQMPQQQIAPMQPMPNMPPMPQMPQQQMAPMKPMPNIPPMPQMPQQQMAPMKPMPNMPPMPQMPQQQMAPMQPMPSMPPMPQMPAYPTQEQARAPYSFAPPKLYANYRPHPSIRYAAYRQ